MSEPEEATEEEGVKPRMDDIIRGRAPTKAATPDLEAASKYLGDRIRATSKPRPAAVALMRRLTGRTTDDTTQEDK